MKIEHFKNKITISLIFFISISLYINVNAELWVNKKNSCILYNWSCYSTCVENHSNILTFMNGGCEQKCCIIENTNSNLINIIIFLFFIIFIIYLIKINNRKKLEKLQ